MSEVSYSNVPPMMAAIRGGDIETLRSLLHAGHSPNEPQCYQVTIGAWPREEETSPLELAVLENRRDPDILSILDRLGMDLKRYGGEALRSMASQGNQMLAEYLIQNGADINYHKPDMVFPYACLLYTSDAADE